MQHFSVVVAAPAAPQDLAKVVLWEKTIRWNSRILQYVCLLDVDL